MNEQEKQAYLTYLASRKSSNKHNYHKECLKQLQRFQKENPNKTPRVLLHACCVVCGCWPIEFLKNQGCDVTVMYNNSNIWPKAEHDHRLHEIERLIAEKYPGEVELIVAPYDYEAYKTQFLQHREKDPEGWKSCFACYGARMSQAFRYADEHGFDFFTSVLTFSRQKDSEKINQIGINLGHGFHHTKWLVSDFKKANGHMRSQEISDEFGFYHQDYCGCEFSAKERDARMSNITKNSEAE